MQRLFLDKTTPQDKIVGVNNKFGNTNIKNQQGTTRVLFDAVPLTAGQTQFRFFENASTRPFPLTNLTSDGNKLTVGSTFTIEKIYFQFVTYANDIITDANAPSFFGGGTGDFYVPFVTGEIDINIANSQVVKNLPTTFAISSELNPTSVNGSDKAFGFVTDIVIPPLLEYIVTLRTTAWDAAGNTNNYTHIQLFLQGTAGIIAPQTTF